MVETKKCPFCGAEAFICADLYRRCYCVMCSNCYVRTSPMWWGKTKAFVKEDFGEVFKNDDEARKRAIEIWNNRTAEEEE